MGYRMTIIVLGVDNNHVKEVSCHNCASKLSYVDSDTKREIHYDHGGGSDAYDMLTCPVCQYKITVR